MGIQIRGTTDTITASDGSLIIQGASFVDSGLGIGIATAGGQVGNGATTIDFRGAGISTVTVSSGIATVNISGGGGAGAVGGGGDEIFYENDQEVTTNYEITTGKNAMSAGPIGIATGITVTIPSGSAWTIV
jgi:hypothetical protein